MTRPIVWVHGWRLPSGRCHRFQWKASAWRSGVSLRNKGKRRSQLVKNSYCTKVFNRKGRTGNAESRGNRSHKNVTANRLKEVLMGEQTFDGAHNFAAGTLRDCAPEPSVLGFPGKFF